MKKNIIWCCVLLIVLSLNYLYTKNEVQKYYILGHRAGFDNGAEQMNDTIISYLKIVEKGNKVVDLHIASDTDTLFVFLSKKSVKDTI